MSSTLAPPVAGHDGLTEHGGGRRTRVAVVLVALVVGMVIAAAFAVWQPTPDGPDDGYTYASLTGMHDAWTVWHVVGSIGTAVALIAAWVVVVLLAPRRGAALATAGALVTSLGALAYVAGASAEGVLFGYATDPQALPLETGRTFVEHVNDDPWRLVGVLFAGFVLTTLGVFLLAGALWRAGTVPRWLAAALALVNLATAVAPIGTPMALAVVAFGAVLLTIGWQLWRRDPVGVDGDVAAP